MRYKAMSLISKTWCLGFSAMIVASLGCGQGTKKPDGPALPAAATQVKSPPRQSPPKQALAALEAYIDSRDGLLPASYAVQDVFISGKVSKFNDDSFDFALARAANAGFTMDRFLLSQKVGFSYAEILLKEMELWDSHGFLKCKVRVERNGKARAVFTSDGRLAVEISVTVILTDVTDAVPSLKDSALTCTLGYLMRSAHTEEKPLKYSATIVVAQQGDRFVVGSHGSEGRELAPEVLQTIIRRNAMTLLSLELVGFLKKAGEMVLFPKGERISLERLRGFDRDQKQAGEKVDRLRIHAEVPTSRLTNTEPVSEKVDRERIHAEEIRAAEPARDSIEDATKGLVDAIPSRAAGVTVHVAFSQEVRDQLRHNALNIGLFDAVAHLWELRASTVRSRSGYSAKQLAKEAAAMIHEFGVATVTCDLEIGRPSLQRSAGGFQFSVTYRVVSVDAERPRAAVSWIAAATWAALPKQGNVTLAFPVVGKGAGDWRIGYALPAGELLGRSDPVLAWGEPVDVLHPQSVLNAVNRAVAESLAVHCERAVKEAIDLSPADRIQKNSVLFGGIECLPEAAPKEDGTDLALLFRIAEEVDSGVFWEKRLPGVSAANQDSVASVLKRLSAVLKPKNWTGKLNERIVAIPVLLSDSHVMFDLGGGQQTIVVKRDACDDAGSRLLDRIEQIAVDSVMKINEAARSRAGVPSEQADAAWELVSRAVRSVVSANGDEGQKAVVSLAAVFVSLGSDSATESVRADLARSAAAAVELSFDQDPRKDKSRLLEPFLGREGGALGIRPGVAAYAKMLLAAGERKQCLEVAENAIDHDHGPSDKYEYGRVAWILGSALMADGKASQAVKWLRKAKGAFAEARGKNALPPAELLNELGGALVATGQVQAGEQALKEARGVLLLTYGEGDSRVKQFDAAQTASKPETTE